MGEMKIISVQDITPVKLTHENFKWAEDLVHELIPDTVTKSEFFDDGKGYGIAWEYKGHQRAITLMMNNEVLHDKESLTKAINLGRS